jgi:hypothetical protein
VLNQPVPFAAFDISHSGGPSRYTRIYLRSVNGIRMILDDRSYDGIVQVFPFVVRIVHGHAQENEIPQGIPKAADESRVRRLVVCRRLNGGSDLSRSIQTVQAY